MSKKIFLTLALIASPFVASAAYTNPTLPPPTCPDTNPACWPPVNVSSFVQTKAGGLNILGNIGIGKATPRGVLDVFGSNPIVTIGHNVINAGSTTLRFSHRTDTVQQKTAIISNATGAWGMSNLYFALNSAGDNSNATIADSKLTILNNGNVGIGLTVPTSKLDVKGSVALGEDNVLGSTLLIRGKNTGGAVTPVGIQNYYGNLNIYTGDNQTIALKSLSGAPMSLLYQPDGAPGSTGADGTIVSYANKILASDSQGNARWVELNGDSCGSSPIGTTGGATGLIAGNKLNTIIDVPEVCKGDITEADLCSLRLLVHRQGELKKIVMIDYIQDNVVNPQYPKWWSNYRPNGVNVNGDTTPRGISRCLVSSGSSCLLSLYDDYTESSRASESTPAAQWVLRDNSSNWSASLYLCTQSSLES